MGKVIYRAMSAMCPLKNCGIAYSTSRKLTFQAWHAIGKRQTKDMTVWDSGTSIGAVVLWIQENFEKAMFKKSEIPGQCVVVGLPLLCEQK